jgi:hypothetical protein
MECLRDNSVRAGRNRTLVDGVVRHVQDYLHRGEIKQLDKLIEVLDKAKKDFTADPPAPCVMMRHFIKRDERLNLNEAEILAIEIAARWPDVQGVTASRLWAVSE